jgi:glycosyltransferase involved in cell wall biosynthesis
VVIPALNEADNLQHVLPRIPAWVHEVLLVDGGSTDDTVEVARQLYPTIRVLRQIGRGKGQALRQGFTATTGDLIVMLDADGSTDPREIPFFVGALMAGADFAKGTRYAQGGGSADTSIPRAFGNRTFTLMYRLLFRNRCTDLCYGYNAFRAEILPLLDIDTDGFEIETLMNTRVFRAGLKVTEVPSFEARRIHGDSKLRALPDGWRILRTLLRERFRSTASRPVGLPTPETN